MISKWDILFIEPQNQASEIPVKDDVTKIMIEAFRTAKPVQPYYKGFHTCICGKTSAGYNFRLANGQVTNSLCVHYLEYHRDEVPQEELRKVLALTYIKAHL